MKFYALVICIVFCTAQFVAALSKNTKNCECTCSKSNKENDSNKVENFESAFSEANDENDLKELKEYKNKVDETRIGDPKYDSCKQYSDEMRSFVYFNFKKSARRCSKKYDEWYKNAKNDLDNIAEKLEACYEDLLNSYKDIPDNYSIQIFQYKDYCEAQLIKHTRY